MRANSEKRPVPAELTALRWMVRVFFVAFAVLRLLAVWGVEISLAGELSVLIGGLLVIAHMAATVIGTTRRNAAPDEPAGEREAWAAEKLRLAAGAVGVRLPAGTSLREDMPTGVGVFVCVVGLAATAALAMAAATFPAWLQIGVAGVLILELSAATIGAYFGYMAARLSATLRKAWAEAAGEDA
jgi:hypothetical protein